MNTSFNFIINNDNGVCPKNNWYNTIVEVVAKKHVVRYVILLWIEMKEIIITIKVEIHFLQMTT